MVTNLFNGGDYSAGKLAQVDRNTSFIVLAAAGLVGPLLVMLFIMIDMPNLSGMFGRLFLNIFLAGVITNLLSYGVLVGLLFGWCAIKQREVSVNAHLAVTSVAAAVLFITMLLMQITTLLPWMDIGNMLIALVIYRYASDTFEQKKVLEPLAVLAAYLIIGSMIVDRIVMSIF